MTDQLSLLDGTAQKEVGMARADDAADQAWREAFDRAIGVLAARGEPFTATDVRDIVGDPPSHPNAAGARFNSAARHGVIEQIGYVKSTRPSLHSHPVCLWRGAV